MNLYFLLEGRRGESLIYPAWMSAMEPPFTRLMAVDHVKDVDRRSFYAFSAEGYPSIIGAHLENAISDVARFPGYDYLVVCLDVDESDVSERVSEVERVAEQKGLSDTPVRLFVVPQNRCIESWVLGNPRIIGASPPPYLAELRDFYDVRVNCPEEMGHPRNWKNHAQFHFHYVREAFKAKRMRYSKRHPGDVATASYFQALRSRIERDPGCLDTFRKFVNFVDAIE